MAINVIGGLADRTDAPAANKYQAAVQMAKSSLGNRASDQDLRKEVDSIYKDQFGGTEDELKGLRGENGFLGTIGSAIRGTKDAIDNVSLAGGNALDAIWDTGAGLLGNDDAKDWFTGQDLAVIPDLAMDMGLTMAGPLGWAAMLGKNAIQQSDNLYEGWTGRDDITGEKLTDDQANARFLEGLVGTGLAAIPGGKYIGKGAKAVGEAAEATGKAATKGAAKEAAGESADEASKAASKKLGGKIKETAKSISDNIPERAAGTLGTWVSAPVVSGANMALSEQAQNGGSYTDAVGRLVDRITDGDGGYLSGAEKLIPLFAAGLFPGTSKRKYASRMGTSPIMAGADPGYLGLKAGVAGDYASTLANSSTDGGMTDNEIIDVLRSIRKERQ